MDHPHDGPAPRITPGTRDDIGLLNTGIVRVVGLAAGGAPPNVFTTLARHRRLFRRWLRFAGAMMPGGTLRRPDSELLVLRVAHNTGSAYEWAQHARIALSTGLTAEDVERVREGPDAEGWTPRQTLLLRAADELHDTHSRRRRDLGGPGGRAGRAPADRALPARRPLHDARDDAQRAAGHAGPAAGRDAEGRRRAAAGAQPPAGMSRSTFRAIGGPRVAANVWVR